MGSPRGGGVGVAVAGRAWAEGGGTDGLGTHPPRTAEGGAVAPTTGEPGTEDRGTEDGGNSTGWRGRRREPATPVDPSAFASGPRFGGEPPDEGPCMIMRRAA